MVRDHQAAGTRPQDIVRELKLQPFRAQKLAEQAGSWSPAELDAALEGLLELDLASKGISLDGTPRSMSDARSALGLQAWLAGRSPQAAGGSRPGSGVGAASAAGPRRRYSAEDQASSWSTRSDSMAKTQRLSERSSSSISSGSM